MNKFTLACMAGLLLTSHASQAEIGVTAYTGQTYSQSVTTTRQQKHEFSDDTHYGLSVDWHEHETKYGLFYSKYDGHFEESTTHTIKSEYLLFQSAVYRPIYRGLNAYIGMQLGVNHLDTNFAEADTFFATGLFGGLEYQVIDNLSIGTEARWLATLIKNKSKVICDNDPNTTNMCSWHFDGETLNQYQLSATLTYRF
jgi:opacity protein-like surface antigen